ncbi:MAG TPA: Cu(I)-responsive transcriptional regulator [Magnetospirillaceae bacterium]|nr:Cu(I)-responsive transcriptional regulator [Magnetospirillaceae bacterium]
MNIGAAARASGVSAKMIRYYESVGLIGAARRSESGYRTYGQDDVSTLQFIRHARHLGFPLPEVTRLLALWRDGERASADVKQLALAHIEEIDRKIAHMAAMRDTLRQLAERCHGDGHPDCSILDELASPPKR